MMKPFYWLAACGCLVEAANVATMLQTRHNQPPQPKTAPFQYQSTTDESKLMVSSSNSIPCQPEADGYFGGSSGTVAAQIQYAVAVSENSNNNNDHDKDRFLRNLDTQLMDICLASTFPELCGANWRDARPPLLQSSAASPQWHGRIHGFFFSNQWNATDSCRKVLHDEKCIYTTTISVYGEDLRQSDVDDLLQTILAFMPASIRSFSSTTLITSHSLPKLRLSPGAKVGLIFVAVLCVCGMGLLYYYMAEEKGYVKPSTKQDPNCDDTVSSSVYTKSSKGSSKRINNNKTAEQVFREQMALENIYIVEEDNDEASFAIQSMSNNSEALLSFLESTNL